MKKPVKMLTGCGLCLLLNAAAAGTALAAGWTSESGCGPAGTLRATMTVDGRTYYFGENGVNCEIICPDR